MTQIQELKKESPVFPKVQSQLYVSVIENLRPVVFLTTIMPYWIKEKMSGREQAKTVHYIDGSAVGIVLCKLAGWFLKFEIKRMDFKLSDIRDEKGDAVSLRSAYQDMFDVQRYIWNDAEFLKFREADDVRLNGLDIFLKKVCVDYISWEDHSLLRGLFLVHVVHQMTFDHENESVERVIFSKKRLWNPQLNLYAAAYHVKMVSVSATNFHVRNFLKNRFGEQRILSWFYRRMHFKRKLKTFFKGRKAVDSSHSIKKSGKKILVEYYGHLNLDNKKVHSDLFFWQNSRIRGEDIDIAFNLPQDLLDQEKLEAIKKHGMSAVVLNPRASEVQDVSVFFPQVPRANFLWIKKELAAVKRPPLREWLGYQVRNYLEERAYWERLFVERNIGVYVSWYKYTAKHYIIRDAINRAGGILAIYQRAFEDMPTPETTINADVVFGNSLKGMEIEKSGGSRISHYVATGYLGDFRFDELRPQAQELRNQLKKNGAQRIIAFFDENSHDDPRWLTGHDYMRTSYAFLMEKVLEDPSIGVVLKPKTPHTLKQRMGPVMNLLEKAQATGRCVVIGGGALYGSNPPSLAALASDMSIHGHLCTGTAGMESALAGIPTLLMDPDGWSRSSLNKLGHGKVVFKEWNHLWQTCQDYWANPESVPGFGSWDPLIHELDPFRDGRAAERMGAFLQDLLDGFKSGLKREEALARAAEQYTKLWGKDKIQRINC